jgi:DNA-binding protein H-NS
LHINTGSGINRDPDSRWGWRRNNGTNTMTHFNLDEMSLDELRSLQKQVNQAIDGYKERQRQKALAELESKAHEMGFSLSDLVGNKKLRKGGIPKYRNPDDPTMTWTGKGRRPDWIKKALAEGKSLDDLSI